MSVDRLIQAKSRPLLIERAIRTALHDAIAWRIGGGSAPDAEAFATAAIAALRLALDGIGADSAERSHSLAAVNSAARRFTGSALYGRLRSIPASRFLRLRPLRHGPDVVLRDRRRRPHAIVLTSERDAFEAGRIAARAARATPLPSVDRLTPLTVHVFSLVSAKRHTFSCDVAPALSERVAV